jgi:hypothetical protein
VTRRPCNHRRDQTFTGAVRAGGSLPQHVSFELQSFDEVLLTSLDALTFELACCADPIDTVCQDSWPLVPGELVSIVSDRNRC